VIEGVSKAIQKVHTRISIPEQISLPLAQLTNRFGSGSLIKWKSAKENYSRTGHSLVSVLGLGRQNWGSVIKALNTPESFTIPMTSRSGLWLKQAWDCLGINLIDTLRPRLRQQWTSASVKLPASLPHDWLTSKMPVELFFNSDPADGLLIFSSRMASHAALKQFKTPQIVIKNWDWVLILQIGQRCGRLLNSTKHWKPKPNSSNQGLILATAVHQNCERAACWH